jgi:hypothetical protein
MFASPSANFQRTIRHTVSGPTDLPELFGPSYYLVKELEPSVQPL